MSKPLEVVIIAASECKRKFKWGEVVDGIKFFACTEPQLDILASKAKYTFAFAGSGGGKTCLIGPWLFKQFNNRKQTNEPWRTLVVSPTEKTFSNSQLKHHIVSTFDGTAAHGRFIDKSKKYVFPGGEIVVITAQDDYERLSGGQYDCIVLDEAFQMRNPAIWEECRRRSNIKEAPILGVTTPNCDGWIYEEVYQRWEAGDADYYVRQWKTSDNPAKSPEEHAKFLDQELLKMGRERFDRLYGGQFSQLTGLVYGSFSDPKAAAWPVIETLARLPSPAVRAFGGIDWGWEDPASAFVAVHCENDLVYIVEEIYGSRIEIDELGRRIKAMQDRWCTSASSRYSEIVTGGFFDSFYCDVSRPESKNLVGRYGVPIRGKKIPNIEAGISIVDQLFRCNRVKIYDCCTNLIREAKSYSMDEDGKPREDNNHAMDALRYGLSSYFANRPINYLEQQAVTAQEKEARELEVFNRLGHATSKEELEIEMKKQHQKKQEEWMHQMLLMDDPD